MSYIRMIISFRFYRARSSEISLYLLAAKVQSNKRALPLSLFGVRSLVTSVAVEGQPSLEIK